jgi:hypothetical protein
MYESTFVSAVVGDPSRIHVSDTAATPVLSYYFQTFGKHMYAIGMACEAQITFIGFH